MASTEKQNGTAPAISAQTRYEQRRAELVAKREPALKVEAEARAARDLSEIDAVFNALDEQCDGGSFDDHVIKLDTAAELVGHIVIKKPSKPVYDRYRTTTLRAGRPDTRGAEELTVKARRDLVKACLAYPAMPEGLPKWEALEGSSTALLETVANKIIVLADASATEDAKK